MWQSDTGSSSNSSSMDGVVPFETGMAKLHRGSGGISQLLGWEVSARRPKQSIPLGKVVEVRGR